MPEPAGPRGRPHRRGGGDDRRRGRGDGRRRPRQHRVADPVARRAGHRARRRGDPPRDRADGRLRGRRQPRAEGQGRPDAALARAPRRLRRARHAEVGRARGAVRRPRPRAAPDQGSLPRLRGRGQGAPRLDHRHRRDRQVAAGLGVLQVLRRDRPDRRTGTAAAASPTARASPTGRSRTWCGCARGSPRTRSRARRSPSSRAVVEEHIADPEERRFVEPRLAHLLGLEEESARLRARGPVRRLAALLRAAGRRLPGGDALRGHAVGGRVAARLHRVPARVEPQLADPRRHAGAAGAARAAADLGRRPPQLQLALPRAALAPRRWRSCSPASFPGLPAELRTQILARAEGIPLYAVETVRMLLDRGALVQEGPVYRPTGDDRVARGARDAARADRRAARRPPAGRAARRPGRGRARQDVHEAGARRRWRELPEAELEPILSSLARKEVFGVQADPRSPEHGQYGFLQDLLRKVAYETLAKADRKARHLAAAAFLEQALDRAGGRRGRRLALPRRLRGGARRGRRGRRSGRRPASSSPAPASAPRRSARTRRPSATSPRRPSSTDDPLAKAELARAGRADGLARRHADARRERYLDQALARLRGRGAARGAAARVSAVPGRDRLPRGPPARGGRRGSRRRSRRSPARSPTRTSPSPPRSSAASSCSVSQHDARRAPARGRARARRGAAPARGLRPGADEQVAPLLAAQPARGGAHPARGRARARARQRPARRRVPGDQQPGGQPRVERPLRATPSRSPTGASSSPGRVGDRVWEEIFLLGPISALVLLGRWDEALAREAESAESESAESVAACCTLVVVECARGDIAAGEERLDEHAELKVSDDPQVALRVRCRRGARAPGRGQARGGARGGSSRVLAGRVRDHVPDDEAEPRRGARGRLRARRRGRGARSCSTGSRRSGRESARRSSRPTPTGSARS